MVLLVGIGTCNKGEEEKEEDKKKKKKIRRKRGKIGRKGGKKKGGGWAGTWNSTLPLPFVFKLSKLLSLAKFKGLHHPREARDKVVSRGPI